MPSLPYDLTEDGAPCVFADGPKQGHTGCVTPTAGGTLPASLEFLNGRLVYALGRRRTIRGRGPDGRARDYRGVEYVMDPKCSVAIAAAQADAEATAVRSLKGDTR